MYSKEYLHNLRKDFLRARIAGQCAVIKERVFEHAKSGETQYFWLSTGAVVEAEIPEILTELKKMFPDSEVVQTRNEFGPGILVNWA